MKKTSYIIGSILGMGLTFIVYFSIRGPVRACTGLPGSVGWWDGMLFQEVHQIFIKLLSQNWYKPPFADRWLQFHLEIP